MSQNEKPPTNTLIWGSILGLLGVILTAYFSYRGIISGIEIPIKATQTAEAKLSASIGQVTSALPDTPRPGFTDGPAITPLQPVCLYQGSSDDETIVNLINLEATAVNTRDFDLIMNIFNPSAIFYDRASDPPKIWDGPVARYENDLFKTVEFRAVEHFDILPAGPGIDGNIAYYTSGSKGSYRVGDGNWQNFFNSSLISEAGVKSGSDHWSLRKNDKGCWVITKLEFNASHIEFP